MTPPPPFVNIPAALLKTRVPASLIVLYARLRVHAETGCVKHATLAAELGVSRRQIINLINELKTRGVVVWTRRKRCNEYQFPGEVFHRGGQDVNSYSSHQENQDVKPRSSHQGAYDLRVLENTNGGRGNGGSGGKGTAAVYSPATKKPPTRDDGPRQELRRAAAGGSAASVGRFDPLAALPTTGEPRRVIERPRPQKPKVDFWPFTGEDVAFVRSLLFDLGREVGLGPPDDEIVRRVLDCGKGADAAAIVRTVRYLFERKKFNRVQSWGLVPTIVEQFLKSP